MVNAIYPTYKAFVIGQLLTEDVKVVLLDLSQYTYSATHQFLSDIPVAARVATSPNLTGKSVSSGVFRCNNFVFSQVSGARSEAVVIYIDTGVPGTSRLVVFLDQDVSGLPIDPDGLDIGFNVNVAGFFGI